MLWRIAPVALLPLVGTNPVALAAAAGYVYLRKTEDVVRPESSHPRADFIAGPDGVERNDPNLASIVAVATPAGVVAEAVLTAGAAVADATSEAVAAVGTATREAATWVGGTVSGAASRVKKQFTNEEANARLRADAALKMELMEEMARLKHTKPYFARMRAMFAVGISIAYADGHISDAEREHIQEYVGGASHADLPADLIGALQGWLACPPPLEEAFQIALECGLENMHFFENVIEVAIRADPEEHPAELEFQARWKAMAEAARA